MINIKPFRDFAIQIHPHNSVLKQNDTINTNNSITNGVLRSSAITNSDSNRRRFYPEELPALRIESEQFMESILPNRVRRSHLLLATVKSKLLNLLLPLLRAIAWISI